MYRKTAALALSIISLDASLSMVTPVSAGLSVNQEVMLCISKASTPADKQACIDFWKERTPTQTSPADQGQKDLKLEPGQTESGAGKRR